MKILLTAQNTTFKIDQEDYEWVNKWTWHISNTWGYISRPQRFNGIQSTISLHIEILKRMGKQNSLNSFMQKKISFYKRTTEFLFIPHFILIYLFG